MTSPSDTNYAEELLKPTNRINFNLIDKTDIGFDPKLLGFNDGPVHPQQRIYFKRNPKYKPEINLFDFSRLYTIGHIPVIDFVIVYIILYCLNCLCLDFDFKVVLIGAIPLTILINLLSNDKVNISVGLLTVLFVTIIVSIHSLVTLEHGTGIKTS